MTTLDEYEHRRGPVYRRPTRPQKKRVERREAQLALKLIGGTNAKDKGQPFDDDIDFIGCAPIVRAEG